jgi:hypothetical protein
MRAVRGAAWTSASPSLPLLWHPWQVAGMLGYSNDDNPFGDSNLSQQFVWHKKMQKVEVETGALRTLAGLSTPRGASRCCCGCCCRLPSALLLYPACACPLRSGLFSLGVSPGDDPLGGGLLFVRVPPGKSVAVSKSDHKKRREEYLEELRKVCGRARVRACTYVCVRLL